MTFSIVARDPQTGELGIAVQSKFLAVGAVVPWARAGVGAIATQSWANTSYGLHGLQLLAEGLSASETLTRLISNDAGRTNRQVGIVALTGEPMSYTSDQCYPWLAVELENTMPVRAIFSWDRRRCRRWQRRLNRDSPCHLADRLVAALAAGQAAGGDSRGQQSAALLVVRAGGGYGGFNDRFIDLRVDDHSQPIAELRRILAGTNSIYFHPIPTYILPIDEFITRELQTLL